MLETRELLKRLGIDEDILSDLINEAMLEQASTINEQGIDAQLKFFRDRIVAEEYQRENLLQEYLIENQPHGDCLCFGHVVIGECFMMELDDSTCGYFKVSDSEAKKMTGIAQGRIIEIQEDEVIEDILDEMPESWK